MCGLAGFLTQSTGQTPDEMRRVVGQMANSMQHRGPDDSGSWCDPASGIALGFRRLSIVDLSPLGHQPMTSSCGRFVIAFNGEIYNHHELRAELEEIGRVFRGRSDTEVLVEGFSEWGIRSTITRCLGMFAIAVWDTHRQELTLIRDRLGKKPLYYGRFGGSILFASELKGMRVHPEFRAQVNRNAVEEYLCRSYLSNQSIYEGVLPLRPGEMLTVQREQRPTEPSSLINGVNQYWSFKEAVDKGKAHPFSGSYDAAVRQLDALLTDAVGRRMEADVPLGAFLSGGIDSSLVVAIMQKLSSRPVKTFTIGFEIEAFNEAPYAAQVARHLRTEHTELMIHSDQAREVIPLLPKLYDEPFGDSSQIPTYLVSQLARREVTVALTGDGGDEIFCGYRRYFEALQPYFTDKAAPASWKSRIGRYLQAVPSPMRVPLLRTCQFLQHRSSGRPRRLLSRLTDVLGESGPHARYFRNLSHWRRSDEPVRGLDSPNESDAPETEFERYLPSSLRHPHTATENQQAWQAYDTITYLPGDILTKVDRASMGVSLEARTPLLDHRIVEFAWSLPHEFKVHNGLGKRILRDVLANYVPRALFERPKVGFGVPIGEWLREPLREWGESLLNRQRLDNEGFLNATAIREKWEDHLRGHADWSYLLWDVLMFQTWLAAYPPEDR